MRANSIGPRTWALPNKWLDGFKTSFFRSRFVGFKMSFSTQLESFLDLKMTKSKSHPLLWTSLARENKKLSLQTHELVEVWNFAKEIRLSVLANTERQWPWGLMTAMTSCQLSLLIALASTKTLDIYNWTVHSHQPKRWLSEVRTDWSWHLQQSCDPNTIVRRATGLAWITISIVGW